MPTYSKKTYQDPYLDLQINFAYLPSFRINIIADIYRFVGIIYSIYDELRTIELKRSQSRTDTTTSLILSSLSTISKKRTDKSLGKSSNKMSDKYFWLGLN